MVAASGTAWRRTRAASTAWSAASRSRASTTPTSAARAVASRSRWTSRVTAWASEAGRPRPRRAGAARAGLTAGEVAARRGDDVTVFEREDELGGRLRLVRGLGDAAELFRSVEW